MAQLNGIEVQFDKQQPGDTVAAAQFTHILAQLAPRVANEPATENPHSFAASTY